MDLVQRWNKAVTNGSRDFVVISGHFEGAQVANKRQAWFWSDQALLTEIENDSKRRRFKNKCWR